MHARTWRPAPRHNLWITGETPGALWINASAPHPWGWGGTGAEDDYFGNCPRSTCGRGERQRRGMIMRENA